MPVALELTCKDVWLQFFPHEQMWSFMLSGEFSQEPKSITLPTQGKICSSSKRKHVKNTPGAEAVTPGLLWDRNIKARKLRAVATTMKPKASVFG